MQTADLSLRSWAGLADCCSRPFPWVCTFREDRWAALEFLHRSQLINIPECVQKSDLSKHSICSHDFQTTLQLALWLSFKMSAGKSPTKVRAVLFSPFLQTYSNQKQLWFDGQICPRSETLWGEKDPRGSPDDAGDPLQSWQLPKNPWVMFVVEPCSSSDPAHQTATLWEALVATSPAWGNRWPRNYSVFVWRDEEACSKLHSRKYRCSK